MSDDLWKHRSSNMCCASCMWFSPKAHANMQEGELYKIGRCRRHAPSMNGYPVVFVSDWCGDHKVDENKV